MATWRDVRRIALALPDTEERISRDGTASWAVRGKSFAWERPLRRADLEALGPRAPTGPILGIRTADLEMKDALLDGYTAVLVILDVIRMPALRAVLTDSWLVRAPKRTADAYLAARPAVRSRRTT